MPAGYYKTPRPMGYSSEAKDEQIALKAHGQRRISLLWEGTQAVVAVLTAASVLGCCVWMIVTDKNATAAFSLMSSLGTLVLNTYFNRTNHTRVGGPGGDQAGTR